MRKMLFYGAGVFGKYAINRYKLYKMNRPELKGFLDKKPKEDYEGYPVYLSLIHISEPTRLY